MVRRSPLPPGLLDFTWKAATELGLSQAAKTSSARPLCFHVVRRRMHQAVMASAPPPLEPFVLADAQTSIRSRRLPGGSLAVRDGEANTPAGELSRRVEALVNIASIETSAVIPEFTEEDLLAFYEDVLALPETQESETNAPVEASQQALDWEVIEAVSRRLVPDTIMSDSGAATLSKSLLQRRQVSDNSSQLVTELHGDSDLGQIDIMALPPHRRVLHRLRSIVPRLESVRRPLKPMFGVQAEEPVRAAVLSENEWSSLVRVSLRAQDPDSAEETLDLMRRAGFVPAETSLDAIMDYYAECGDASRTERFIQRFVTAEPTERQRHLHIKAYRTSVPAETVPTRALELLHRYENQSLPAPMTTYSSLITSLFSVRSSLAHAQAWDLFAHMRYVAHPNPDALLYTLMIRACASSNSGSAEPERALDLFTEMTVDHRIPPTAGAYSAVILACARSGSKDYINEAFRLAKEMLDSHRDASGRPAFPPEGRTFAALLEGAKRIGDLARARWILAELVRAMQQNSTSAPGHQEAMIDEEIMMHVFHAYAAYRPPFKPSTAPIVDRNSSQPQNHVVPQGHVGDSSSSSTASEAPCPSNAPVKADTDPSFKHLPPQSRADLIHEAKTLFARIVEDSSRAASDAASPPDSDAPLSPFRDVHLTTRLVNSYLSIHYAHSPLDTSHGLFVTMFSDLGVPKNARSFVDALERCAIAQRGHERDIAVSFAGAVWAEWLSLENSSQLPNAHPLEPRLVERAHAAMIRTMALTHQLDRALEHLKDFVSRYPPTAVRQPTVLPAMRSTRTVLVGARPLVRLSSATEVPDDTVPPVIGFTDLEILHHRLVAAGRRDGIGYVKYVCKAYAGALRRRRNDTLQRGVIADEKAEKDEKD